MGVRFDDLERNTPSPPKENNVTTPPLNNDQPLKGRLFFFFFLPLSFQRVDKVSIENPVIWEFSG